LQLPVDNHLLARVAAALVLAFTLGRKFWLVLRTSEVNNFASSDAKLLDGKVFLEGHTLHSKLYIKHSCQYEVPIVEYLMFEFEDCGLIADCDLRVQIVLCASDVDGYKLFMDCSLWMCGCNILYCWCSS